MDEKNDIPFYIITLNSAKAKMSLFDILSQIQKHLYIIYHNGNF